MITQSYARTAGLLYLIIAAFGVFAIAYVPSVIIEAGDAATTAINLLINIMPVFLLSGTAYLNAFEPAQLQATALILFEAHGYGIFIWQLFFGPHLLVLGYMIVKSDLFPRVLGWAMLVGFFGYTIQALSLILQTESAALSFAVICLLTIVTIGELAFAFWLLIKGINLPTEQVKS